MTKPRTAMLLAAGLGLRMRPLTESRPKPLIRVAGKPLVDWSLDALERAGVCKAIVNVHHLSRQMIDHLAQRRQLEIIVSDETERLLDSAGGIVKALPDLGPEPFYVLNADTFWLERGGSALARLAAGWNDTAMDMILMLADPNDATGHGATTDFVRAPDGRLARAAGAADGFIYAGAAIAHPRIFAGAPAEPHSLNFYFDRAIAEGRLHGMVLDGHWITVGTPEAIGAAEEAVGRELAR